MYSLAWRVSSFSKMSLNTFQRSLVLTWESGQLSFFIVNIQDCKPISFWLVCFLLSFLFSKLWKDAENTMAPHSGTLAWKIPRIEKPGRLQSMGSLRVGHNWATSVSLFTFMHWRRKWQSTPVFLPGESQGQGSLMGYHLWGRIESDMTEVT